jgi:hypothetical protein
MRVSGECLGSPASSDNSRLEDLRHSPLVQDSVPLIDANLRTLEVLRRPFRVTDRLPKLAVP